MDIGRINLVELDILTEGLQIVSRPYTVPLKYHVFVAHEIKQLKEAGIILQSMSDWASPTLVVPKKQDCMETNNTEGSSKFNLQLCIKYRKLNSYIQTVHHIKADSSLGKVISNYPLPTINSILAHFNSCKYFSTIDLRLDYYHIKLSTEVAEKTVFITDKGKCIFHSLPFSINIHPSAFSYILGKVLMQCLEHTLNYLNDIMVFSETWKSHLRHLKEVFKWLQEMGLKIKCSKCEFFNSKVHCLGYLVGTDGVQDLIAFYRKFIPFFANVTACLNTMLRKGAVFKWIEQCNNAFNLLKSDLVKLPRLQCHNPNKTFKLFTGASKNSYSGILHQEEVPKEVNAVPNLVPITYFSGSFSKMQQLWTTNLKECYTVYGSIHRFSFYLAGTKCTLYSDHKPLAPFFTTGMSSQVFDCWELELQQFNIQFDHLSGKKNVVADAISRLRTLGLYQDNDNNNVAKQMMTWLTMSWKRFMPLNGYQTWQPTKRRNST